ncbi:hypothetical protein GCM10027592_56510 [Spirosoma flavus]
MMIYNDVDHLTDEERNCILGAHWYSYTQGIGSILLSNGSWHCNDTVGAKQYLDNLGVTETHLDNKNQYQ